MNPDVVRMSSSAKMLSILDLFTEEQPLHTPPEISARLDLTQPTAYRYLRDLVRAGLLANNSGSYCLGPRIIELDYQIRKSDPLLINGEPTMRELADEFRGAVLLSSIYGDKVVNVFHYSADPELKLSFGRGQIIPLAKGATSKVILAFTKRTHLKRLYEAHGANTAFKSIGSDWRGFLASMNAIRSCGYATSSGELDPDYIGVASPIISLSENVTSAVTLILSQKRFALHNDEAIIKAVKLCAKRLEATLASDPLSEPTGQTETRKNA